MRRAFLRHPEDPHRTEDGSLFVREEIVREAALVLSDYAVNGGSGALVGDPVHEEVTEGRTLGSIRRRQAGSKEVSYSSCGDLPHWLEFRLGYRDERHLNRDGDGGSHRWSFGRRNNITMLSDDPAVVKASKGSPLRPEPGDILFVMNSFGGHVCILRAWEENRDVIEPMGVVVTDDYGQPDGQRRYKNFARRGGVWYLGHNPLLWWVDITKLRFTESAVLPDACMLGVEDENPYEEPGIQRPVKD